MSAVEDPTAGIVPKGFSHSVKMTALAFAEMDDSFLGEAGRLGLERLAGVNLDSLPSHALVEVLFRLTADDDPS